MLENSEKLNNQAVRLASKGEYEDAIACLKRAITVENSNYLLWFNLALTYHDAGKASLAKSAMEHAYRINPYDEDTLESLASFCVSTESFDEALFYCAQGLELNPINPHYWNTSGVVRFNQGDFAAAVELFEHAVSLSPHYYDALFNLRDTYEELQNKTGVQECSRMIDEISKNFKPEI
ncbi:tetratricopeptide repeat protein [Treponema sp.]|uniref:tetratricopeptide repeat protein n=1 Tax=Treponema sp. TaxID=166 RepID=UPI003F038C21